MLRVALAFLIVAMVAGLFGFTSVSGTAYESARLFFFVFIVLFVISAILGYNGRRQPLV